MLNIETKINNDESSAGTLYASDFNTVVNNIQKIIEESGDTIPDDSKYQLSKAVNILVKNSLYKDIGIVNDIKLVRNGLEDLVLDAYSEDMSFSFLPKISNTGPTTLRINNLPSKPLMINGNPLVGGELKENKIHMVDFDINTDAFNLVTLGNMSKGMGGTTNSANVNGDVNLNFDVADGVDNNNAISKQQILDLIDNMLSDGIESSSVVTPDGNYRLNMLNDRLELVTLGTNDIVLNKLVIKLDDSDVGLNEVLEIDDNDIFINNIKLEKAISISFSEVYTDVNKTYIAGDIFLSPSDNIYRRMNINSTLKWSNIGRVVSEDVQLEFTRDLITNDSKRFKQVNYFTDQYNRLLANGDINVIQNFTSTSLLENTIDDFILLFDKVEIKNFSVSDTSIIIVDINDDVWVSGSNLNGQLGLGDNINRIDFVKIPYINKVSSVHISNYSSMLLMNDGTVMSCGLNDVGQLGLDDTVSRDTFTTLQNFNNIVEVYFNTVNFFIRDATNQVFGCGLNTSGQLGLGDEVNRLLAELVSTDVVEVLTPSTTNIVFIKSNRSGYITGDYLNGVTGLGTQVANLTTLTPLNVRPVLFESYLSNSLMVTDDGALWVTGLNANDELGLDDPTTKIDWVNTGQSGVVDIKLVGDVAFFLRNDGLLFGTGVNTYGQLGLGDTTPRTLWSSLYQGIDAILNPSNGFSNVMYHYDTLGQLKRVGRFLDEDSGVYGDMELFGTNSLFIIETIKVTDITKLT